MKHLSLIILLLFLLPSGWSEAATFGYTSVGASMTSSYEDDVALGRYNSIPAGAGDVDSISSYTENLSAGTCNYRVGLYTDSDDSIVANSEGSEQTFNDLTGEWRTYTYSGTKPSVTAQQYLVAIWAGCPSTAYEIYYDESDVPGDSAWDTTSYSGVNSFPSPFSAGATAEDNDNRLSLYATYTASGGGAESPKDEFQMIFSQAFIHTLIAPPRKFYQVNDTIDV